MDTPICTVGIGPTEAHVDWELLRGLAERTDGEYLFAKKGEDLVNFFVACRQGIVGDVRQIAGYVSPGRPSVVEPLTISENVCELSLALNYVSGNLALDIVDPEGEDVVVGYPDFTLQTGESLKLYTILTPRSGEWKITVNSGDTTEDEVFYNIVITSNQCQQTPTLVISPTPYLTRTPLPPPGVLEQSAPILPVVLVVLLGLGIFIWITLRRR